MFFLDWGGVKSVMLNRLEMRRDCPSLAPILIPNREPIIKHGLLKSQWGDTHTVQRETRHQWRILTSQTFRLFALSLFSLRVLKEGDCVSTSRLPYHIFFHTAASKNDVMATARWQPYTCVACVCVCVKVSEGLWFFSHHILFSVSFCYYEWKRQNTCLRVWTCWHGVWCFPFIFLSLFSFLLELLIIPSDTQTFLLYIEPCENWHTLPRLIGFMYCMTEACARRHKVSASQDQHLLLGNTHSCSNL